MILRLTLGLFFLASSAHAISNSPFVFEKKGELPSGIVYELTVKESKYTALPQLQKDDCGMWGADCADPHFSINILSLMIDNKKVLLPFKFFSDLGDVNKIDISDSNSNFKLVILGGDGAGSYSAEFLFNNNRLIERIVRSGEFPDEIWEKTTIGNDLLDHPERY